MNVFELAGNIWHINERLIYWAVDSSSVFLNKMTTFMKLVPKEKVPQPSVKSVTSSSGWISPKKIILIGGTTVGIYFIYSFLKKRREAALFVENPVDDMVYLFTFPRPVCIPSLSPYSLKLETWMRIADINYTVVENLPFFYRSSEGTLPYVEFNGETIVDSANIIDKLSEQQNSTEEHLRPELQALVRSFEAMIEMSLNYCTASYRCNHLDQYMEIWPFPVLSLPVIKSLFKCYFKHKKLNAITAAGIGRHSAEMIEKISFKDLQALSDQLGNKHYLTGFKPTRADACAFAALCFIVYVPFSNPQRRYIYEHCQNLIEFCERIRSRYWPDWPAVTKLRQANTEWRQMIRPSSSRSSSLAA